jgi:hypothetical protein
MLHHAQYPNAALARKPRIPGISVIPLERLHLCADDCLASPFDDSGHALQDVVNEIGTRLGFQVSPGRYRGVKNEVGNDGLWKAKDTFGLLVEVKTTDAYRINLDTVAEYRRRLIAEDRLDQAKSSILIVVGRQDTGDLEAQIRGSRHAWDIRLVSVDGLLRLAKVKLQLDDWATDNKINQLLRPVEYTRLDAIVELLFATAQDLETPEEVPPTPQTDTQAPSSKSPPRAELELAREAAVRRIGSKLGVTFVRRGRALFASSDGKMRLVCLVSKRHEGPSECGTYWFGFFPRQREFLREAAPGYVAGHVAFVCGDSGRVYRVTTEQVNAWLPKLNTTQSVPPSPEKIDHWHLGLNGYADRAELIGARGEAIVDLPNFLGPIS